MKRNRIIACLLVASYSAGAAALPYCEEVFPSVLQSAHNGSRLTLDRGSSVRYDSDNVFEFKHLTQSGNNHCFGQNCSVSGKPAKSLDLPDFPGRDQFPDDPGAFPNINGSSDYSCSSGNHSLTWDLLSFGSYDEIKVSGSCSLTIDSVFWSDLGVEKLIVEGSGRLYLNGQRLFVEDLEVKNSGYISANTASELYAYDLSLEGAARIASGWLTTFGYQSVKIDGSSNLEANFHAVYLDEFKMEGNANANFSSGQHTIKKMEVFGGQVNLNQIGSLHVDELKTENAANLFHNGEGAPTKVYKNMHLHGSGSHSLRMLPTNAEEFHFGENSEQRIRFNTGDYHLEKLRFSERYQQISMEPLGSGSVRLFVEDDVDLSRQVRMNPTAPPRQWMLFSKKEITTREWSTIRGVVYAEGDVDFRSYNGYTALTGIASGKNIHLDDYNLVVGSTDVRDADYSNLCLPGTPPDGSDNYLKFGSVNLSSSSRGTLTGTINYSDYQGDEPPLVFLMTPIEANQVEKELPAQMRVTSASTSQADVELWVAPNYYGGSGVNRTSVSKVDYIVVGGGDYQLKDEFGNTQVRLSAGTVKTCDYKGKYSDGNGNCDESSVWQNLPSGWSSGTAVLAQLQTFNNGGEFYSARVESVSSAGFYIGLEGSEAYNQHGNGKFKRDDTIAYLAVEGSGTVEINGEMRRVESGNGLQSYKFSGNNYNNTRSLAEQCSASNHFNFQTPFASTPLFYSTKRTRYGGDGGWARVCHVSDSQFNVVVEEDFAGDNERKHYGEYFSYLAVGTAPTVEPVTIRLVHPDSAINCVGAQVEVQICSDSSCTSFDKQSSYTLDLTATPTSEWQHLTTGTIGNSQTVKHGDRLQLWQATPSVVEIGVGNYDFVCESGSGQIDCEIGFSDSGLVLTPVVGDLEQADLLACHTQYQLQLGVVETNSSDPKQCLVTTQGTENVSFSFQYGVPQSPEVAADLGLGSLTLKAGEAQVAAVTFDVQGVAKLPLRYQEAGRLKVSASLTRGVGGQQKTFTGEVDLDWVPVGFHIQAQNQACDSNFTQCGAFKKAGEAFPVEVSARCWVGDNDQDLSDNPITRNFQKSDIRLAPELIAPDPGSNSGDDGGTVSITAGGQGSVDRTLTEVGAFRFKLAESVDYLGASLSNFSSRTIGRITPATLEVVAQPLSLQPYCQGSSYFGQPVAFSTLPQFEVTARNLNNQVTNNFDSEFWNLPNPMTAREYQTGVTGIEVIEPTGQSTEVLGANDGDGSRRYRLTENWLRFKRPDTPLAPVDYARIPNNGADDASFGITIAAEDLSVAGDKVCVGTWGSCEGLSFDSASSAPFLGYVTGPQLRYGRMVLDSAYGTELQQVLVPMRLEYFNGQRFVTNTLDNGFNVNNARLSLAGSLDPLPLTNVNGSWEQGEYDGITVVGDGRATPEDSPITLSYQLDRLGFDGINGCQFPNQATEAPTWLQWTWGGNTMTNPSANVTLGRFRGHDKVIYRREVFGSN